MTHTRNRPLAHLIAILMSLIPFSPAIADPPRVPISVTPRTLTLADQGDGDRRVLRYAFAEGHAARYRFESVMLMENQINGKLLENDIPSFYFYEITMAVDRVTDQGEAALTLTIEDAGVLEVGEKPTFEEMMYDAFAEDQIGCRLEMTVGPGGQLKDLALIPRPNLPEQEYPSAPQWDRSLRHFFMLLPEQPVGNGATWVINEEEFLRGAKIQSKLDVTVTSLTESGWSLSAHVLQTAKNQPVEKPIPMQLLKLVGQGDATLRSGSLGGLPDAVTFRREASMTASADYSGSKYYMKTSMTHGATVERIATEASQKHPETVPDPTEDQPAEEPAG